MKILRKIRLHDLYPIILILIFSISLNAQIGISSGGGDISSHLGSVSYTIGQVFYSSKSFSKASINEGLQQPYEIFISSIDDYYVDNFSFKAIVYPNPSSGNIGIDIFTIEKYDFMIRLFDINGYLIRECVNAGPTNELSLHNYINGTYYLQIIDNSNKNNIQTFKILKF